MLNQSLLQSLQRELAIEKAARQELENQTVLKTRQLWQFREQQEKEVQQYQEQLSVLRASLILAHKQQHQQQQIQHVDPYTTSRHPSPDAMQPPSFSAAAAVHIPEAPSIHDCEDASPTKADQRKAATRQFTTESPQKHRSSQQQQQQSVEHGVVTAGSPSTPPAAVSAAANSPPQGAGQQAATAPDVSTPASSAQQPPQDSHLEQQQQQQQVAVSDTAEQLLAAASKVQQLVEQLSGREPSAAADLSVLQWQLTAIYGGLTCHNSSSGSTSDAPHCSSGSNGTGNSCSTSNDNNNSSSNETTGAGLQGQRHGVLQGVSCTGSDPLSATCSPAAAAADRKSSHASAAIYVDATTGTSPQRDAAAAAVVAAVGQADSQQPQQQQQVQELSRTAAAAQLFSGAATSSGSGSKLVAASLCWYYLEPGDPPIVKGPYDAGLMLRWYLGGFLTDALRIAGVVQSSSSSSSSSSRAPPESLDDFQSLGQLLQQVQAGKGYTPAKPGKEQQQQQQHLSPGRRSGAATKLPLSRQQSQLQGQLPGLSLGGVGGEGVGYEGPGGVRGVADDVGMLAKGGSILTDTVGYWLDMAASAQLPGPLSLVQFLDKVVRQAETWD